MSNRKAESLKARARRARAAAVGQRQRHPWRPNFRVLTFAVLSGLVLAPVLTVLMSERPSPPELEPSGGLLTVAKSPQRPTPEPQAAKPEPATDIAPHVQAFPPQQPVATIQTVSITDMLREVQPSANGEPAADPDPSLYTASIADPLPTPPLPDRAPASPAVAEPTASPPAKLPWQPDARQDAGTRSVASLPQPAEAGETVALPSRSDLRGWVRSSAREFVGGVDADGMPLYRFDLWLEAPDRVRGGIQAVTYEYRAPSAKPSRQDSSEAGTGFRVKFGAAACAETATVTLVMKDGRERRVNVDGCKILN